MGKKKAPKGKQTRLQFYEAVGKTRSLTAYLGNHLMAEQAITLEAKLAYSYFLKHKSLQENIFMNKVALNVTLCSTGCQHLLSAFDVCVPVCAHVRVTIPPFVCYVSSFFFSLLLPRRTMERDVTSARQPALRSAFADCCV